jgi:hypothetical protein
MWNNLAEREREREEPKKTKNKIKERKKRIDVNNYPDDLQILPSSETTITETSSWYLRRSPWGISSSSWKSIPANNHQEALIRMRKRRAHQLLPFSIKIFFHSIFPQSVLNLGNKSSSKRSPQVPQFEEGPFFYKFLTYKVVRGQFSLSTPRA